MQPVRAFASSVLLSPVEITDGKPAHPRQESPTATQKTSPGPINGRATATGHAHDPVTNTATLWLSCPDSRRKAEDEEDMAAHYVSRCL